MGNAAEICTYCCLQAISAYVAMLRQLYNSETAQLILDPFILSADSLQEPHTAGETPCLRSNLLRLLILPSHPFPCLTQMSNVEDWNSGTRKTQTCPACPKGEREGARRGGGVGGGGLIPCIADVSASACLLTTGMASVCMLRYHDHPGKLSWMRIHLMEL